MSRTSKLGRAGEIAAWVISVVAWALSFTAQMQLAAAHGFTSWAIWAWPATTDLAGLVGMLIALDQTRSNGSTAVAWLIAIAAAAVMVAANIGAAVGDPVAMLLHAWPPSIALGCWFLLVHVRRAPVRAQVHAQVHASARASAARTDADRAARAARPAARSATTSGTRLEAMLQRATEQGQELDARTVAARLGVTIGHARRLLAQARQPHVVEGQSTPGIRRQAVPRPEIAG
jgi:hypothetical protein